MAYCKIWDIENRPLGEVIRYITDPNKTVVVRDVETLVGYAANGTKTEWKRYVSGVNTEWWTAVDDMKRTKEIWQDKSKKVCYHAIQSWMPGEVTPELAHKIGVELAKKMWGDRFEVVVATHCNTDCIHNHFVINDISFADGKHYHDNKYNYWKMKRASDKLCRENNLSVIVNPKNTGTSWLLAYSDKFADKEHEKLLSFTVEDDEDLAEGAFTHQNDELQEGIKIHKDYLEYGNEKIKIKGGGKDGTAKPVAIYEIKNRGANTINRKVMARMAIDEAVKKSTSLRDFKSILSSMGYTVDLNPNHKYWTIKSETWERPIRMFRLGEDYSNERIMQRIADGGLESLITGPKKEKSYLKASPKVKKVKVIKKGGKKIQGKRALYIHYSFVMGILPRNPKKMRKVIYYSPALREGLRKLDRVSIKTKLLSKYKINTEDDLNAVLRENQNQIEKLLTARKYLYRHNDQTEERQAQLSEISQKLKMLRKETKYLEEVKEESAEVRERLKRGIEELKVKTSEEVKREKEVKEHQKENNFEGQKNMH